jgi:hypothetical protein
MSKSGLLYFILSSVFIFFNKIFFKGKQKTKNLKSSPTPKPLEKMNKNA